MWHCSNLFPKCMIYIENFDCSGSMLDSKGWLIIVTVGIWKNSSILGAKVVTFTMFAMFFNGISVESFLNFDFPFDYPLFFKVEVFIVLEVFKSLRISDMPIYLIQFKFLFLVRYVCPYHHYHLFAIISITIAGFLWKLISMLFFMLTIDKIWQFHLI